MIPWPIALLTLFYGVVATVSAANSWYILTGRSHQPLIWPVAWLIVSGGAMCGLPLLRPWARTLAVWGSGLLIAAMLSVAGVLVMAHRPLGGLLATTGAAVHVVIIRYLQRPAIKAYFHINSAARNV